ncbi:MAG: KR domain-containing protein [Hormoscilla sp. GM102CHS1]|nr:KR domain-containing protein [Hormoscilla sp. GM102CHS1]
MVSGFLDGLAHYRRSMGLPGLSIHWGPISQIGEAAERGADVRFSAAGHGGDRTRSGARVTRAANG